MRIALASLLVTVSLAAQPARPEMLVSTDWLAGHLDTVSILHVGDKASYTSGHIPGAVLLEPSSILVTRDEVPNELAPVEVLAAVFRDAGIGNESRIVLYGEPPFAERAWFTLDYLGHGGRAAVLDGGLRKWIAEGRPVNSEPVTAEAAPFEAHPRTAIVTTLATLREVLGKEEPAIALLDSRPPAQFDDPGHIPGAINVPLGANFKDGVLRPANELRALYEAAGVTKDTANVAYCRTGMQASVTYFVLRYLGYDATVYDGSYAEWSKGVEKRE